MKLVWTLAILASVIYGLYITGKNISDYYKFDVVTNAKIVYPKTVTFPAITICSENKYEKSYYVNKTFIKAETVHENILSKFVNLDSSSFNLEQLSISDLEFFQIQSILGFSDCVRFNGFQNKDLEIINSSLSFLVLDINNVYSTKTSDLTSVTYKFSPNLHYYAVYVADNYLNSYISIQPNYFKKKFVIL